MNNTIQQLQANLKFEKLLTLIGELAPGNKNVQDEISTLSNSKKNFIEKLQTKWKSIKTPNFTELEIREICQSYYENLEHSNEMRMVQGLDRVAIVDSRNWIVKSEQNWFGWDCEKSRYYTEPLLYEGIVNYGKQFDPLIVTNKDSGSLNMIWTLEKFIEKGGQMGLSHDNWCLVWLTLAKHHMQNDFSSLSRYSNDADGLFLQMTLSVNSESEIAKIRSALAQITRKPTEMLQSPLFKMRSLYEMLLSVEFPGMDKDKITLKADHYSAISAHYLVSKNTAEIISQFVSIRKTEGDPNTVASITNLVTQHEASNPGDRISTVLYLPESCTRLDKQATEASNVTDLVLAASQINLGKRRGSNTNFRQQSGSGDRSSRSVSRERKYPYDSRQKGYKRESSRDGHNSRKDSHRKSGDKKNPPRPGERDKFNRSYSYDRKRQISYDKRRQGNNNYDKSSSRSVSKDRGYSKRESPARGAIPRSDSKCVRCDGKHISMDCRQYPYYKGKPCSKCQLMHETKMHRARSSSKERPKHNSRDERPRNSYHIPDFKYRESGDTVYSTQLEQIGAQARDSDQDPNIFRRSKNP